MNTDQLYLRLTKKGNGKIKFIPDTPGNRKFYERLNHTRRNKPDNTFIIDKAVDINNPPALHKTAAQAQVDMQAQLNQQSRLIEQLQKQIESNQNAGNTGGLAPVENTYKYSAADTIRLIKACQTAEEVDDVVGDDDRATVKQEGARRKTQLKTQK